MASCCRNLLSRSTACRLNALNRRGISHDSVDEFRRESRRFKFEYPGENIGNTATYLKGEYQGWSAGFLPHLDVNKWQRQAMFERECEKAMFAENPADYQMEELGFTRDFVIREQIIKIEKQIPTEYVLFHDLKEMWKRRQSTDLPFINVGSFVEVKCRSQWDLARPITYGGIVIEKEHKDLGAFFIVRKNVESYGYGIENLFHMYSPYLESVKVISYQVRDDPAGTLQSIRDLTREQTELQEPAPEQEFDPESGLEIPHFEPLIHEYREQQSQKRFLKSTRHFRPRRADTLRNYKLWETNPDKRYNRKNVKGSRRE